LDFTDFCTCPSEKRVILEKLLAFTAPGSSALPAGFAAWPAIKPLTADRNSSSTIEIL